MKIYGKQCTIRQWAKLSTHLLTTAMMRQLLLKGLGGEQKKNETRGQNLDDKIPEVVETV